MALTKQEQRKVLEAIVLTPEEKRLCLALRIKGKVLPVIESLKYNYSWTASRIEQNGDSVLTFKSNESPTLELRIKGE